MQLVVNFRGYLEDRAKAKSTRKSERTALRLKITTIALLEQPGYHAMTIDEICDKSGLAKGTFYLHAESKKAITLAILDEYTQLQTRMIPAFDETRHPFENLRTIVAWCSDFFRENAGLQRALMQLADTIPEVAEIWQRYTRFLAAHVLKTIRSAWKTEGIDEELMFFTIYLLGNMLDQLLYVVCAVHRQAHLERVAGSPHHMVEMVSLLWYRALSTENPPRELLSSSAPLLKLAPKKPE
ncbi:MAG: TetR/AcrR family transcriptional regulator [Gammaproteobacteria bacterium]